VGVTRGYVTVGVDGVRAQSAYSVCVLTPFSIPLHPCNLNLTNLIHDEQIMRLFYYVQIYVRFYYLSPSKSEREASEIGRTSHVHMHMVVLVDRWRKERILLIILLALLLRR
jgi:hypothetical protein